jgi:hypothetical protein
MELPLIPGEVLGAALAPGARAPGTPLGEHIVRTALSVWEIADIRATFLGLLRSAMTSEKAAVMLREFLFETILLPMARVASADGAVAGRADAAAGGAGAERSGGEDLAADDTADADDTTDTGDLEYRAAMVATQMMGLAIARYVLAVPPVVRASPDDLAATIGPTLDRYLTGEIRPSHHN